MRMNSEKKSNNEINKTFKPVQTSKFASSEVLDTVKEKEIQPNTKGASK